MLTESFPKLNDCRAVRFLRAFFRSRYYIALIVALMVCSELFGAELFVYYSYFLFMAVALLFTEDTLAVVPPAVCGYMTFSAKNNPVLFPDTAVFSKPAAATALIVVLVLIGVFLVSRLIFELVKRPKKGFPKLTVGFLVLGVAYLVGGAFSGHYSARTAFFGAVQTLSLCLFYFYFYYTIDWKNTDKSYLFEVFTIVGVGMLVEIGGMYFGKDVFSASGVNRDKLFTGWGVNNNVGCVMAMCMPAPFWFSATDRRAWGFSVLGCCFYLGVLLTQSRTAMLFGTLLFCACIAYTLVCSRGKQRVGNAIVFGVVILAMVVFVAAFQEEFNKLFYSVIRDEFGSRGRLEIYQACWEVFLSDPLFGVGFYASPGALVGHPGIITAPEGVFLPPRAHNTYVQLLASTGTFGFFAYFYHRFETIALLFRRPSKEKTLIAFSIAALILTSILDCHFFNFGPAILYSILLVFAEKRSESAEETELIPLQKRKATLC